MPTGKRRAARNEQTLTGVVLCGGQSTRMGKDKGLLTEEKQTWAQRAAQKLAGLQLPFVLSLNGQQSSAYAVVFHKEKFVVDNENIAAKGPLLGLLSVHACYPGKDLFVLACDMKDMTARLLRGLLNESTESDNYEAFVYETEEKPQPLCGLYTAGGLNKIYGMLQRGELERFSMLYVLKTLNTRCVAVQAEDVSAFTNYNSPGDL